MYREHNINEEVISINRFHGIKVPKIAYFKPYVVYIFGILNVKEIERNIEITM